MTKQALKAIDNLDAKQYRQVVSSVFQLCKNPEPHDSKKLQGASNGERRQDVGEYRVIYSYDAETIDILIVGKRNDGAAYRSWRR